MRQLPNILTMFRIILTGIFLVLLMKGGFVPMVLAAVVFTFASLTDYYDGYIAKKRNYVSNFGMIMDPIADKVLILVAFFAFVRMEIIPAWMFILIFIREILVTGSRLFAIREGKFIAAEKAGKYKTVSQIVAISVILIYIICRESQYTANWMATTLGTWQWTINIIMIITVALTVFSGLSYFRNRKSQYAQ